MLKAHLTGVHGLLMAVGYRAAFRCDGWFECLLQNQSQAERWVGRGESEDEALGDALHQMLPSHLGRLLLDQYLARWPAAPSAPWPSSIEHSPVPVLSERTSPVRDVPKPPARVPFLALKDPNPRTSTSPVRAEGLLTIERPRTDTVPAVEVFVRAHDPVRIVEPPPEPAPPHVARVELDPAAEKRARARATEALETVERLLREIEDRLGPLARMAAERQRLYMLVWICRARGIEEGLPDVRDVEHAVARVARRLTEIGKMFWPGSVRALQLSARPADVRREMHATWASEPANWREATALAERLLNDHLGKSVEAGLDEDGWADALAKVPPPPDADAMFDDVDAELRTLLASTSGDAPTGKTTEIGNTEFEAVLVAARKLRWLRGCVRDDIAWGVAMGRLRRVLPNMGERSMRVRDVIDYRTKPVVPWGKVLGIGISTVPEEIPEEPTENAAELTAELTQARETKEGLMNWLLRAFDVLNTPDLVALLVPLRSEMAAFGDDSLNHPDRRVRRRLRELVRRVATAAEEAAFAQEHPEPVVVPEPEEPPPVDEPMASTALDDLSERVRAQTRGCRALFVSNRDDPELGARLTDLLGITITWCDGSLRRVQAQCERIARGSYDLVLSATGFQVHGVDSALARASSAADIPYVRVNRGRPVACVQAIAREFGLTSGTFAVPVVKVSSAE